MFEKNGSNFISISTGTIIRVILILFAVYIFWIWFYSHKLKKYPIIGNVTASLLAVLPFFGILLYFKNFYSVIFAHASFLVLLILLREMVKDLENIKGDLANNYQTIPVRFGEKVSKQIITGLTIACVFPVYLLVEKFNVGYMDLYFYISLLLLLYLLS